MVNEVAHHGGVHPVWAVLLRANIINNPIPGHIFEAIGRHLAFVYKNNVLVPSTFPGILWALFAVRITPNFFVLWPGDQVSVFQHLADVAIQHRVGQVAQKLQRATPCGHLARGDFHCRSRDVQPDCQHLLQ